MNHQQLELELAALCAELRALRGGVRKYIAQAMLSRLADQAGKAQAQEVDPWPGNTIELARDQYSEVIR